MAAAMGTQGLELTEDEALALLQLAMTSPNELDAVSEKAIHKLADYCRQNMDPSSVLCHHIEAAG